MFYFDDNDCACLIKAYSQEILLKTQYQYILFNLYQYLMLKRWQTDWYCSLLDVVINAFCVHSVYVDTWSVHNFPNTHRWTVLSLVNAIPTISKLAVAEQSHLKDFRLIHSNSCFGQSLTAYLGARNHSSMVSIVHCHVYVCSVSQLIRLSFPRAVELDLWAEKHAPPWAAFICWFKDEFDSNPSRLCRAFRCPRPFCNRGSRIHLSAQSTPTTGRHDRLLLFKWTLEHSRIIMVF